MKLFVFLGNIGPKYEYTRHNAGFLLGDYLKTEWNLGEWKEEKKFFGAFSEGHRNGEKVFFLKPSTLMNRSGKAVVALKNFYKIPLEHICICYDDKDMEFGKIRFRQKGSSGGQRGIQNCIDLLGTQEIARLKIGVDTPARQIFANTADFVLSRFSAEEQVLLPKIWQQAAAELKAHMLVPGNELIS